MNAEQRGRLNELEEELRDARDSFNRELALARQRITALEEENEELRETVETLADRLSAVEDQLGQPQGKPAKVAALVEYADNKRDDGDEGAKLDVQEIKGATGCSRRYAYDLVDELPEEYACVMSRQKVSQYGSVEIDDQDVGLFVDCELAHEDARLVNHFTTQTEEGEAK